MMQHLGHRGKTELLKNCNLSWTQGILPEELRAREAEMLPIQQQDNLNMTMQVIDLYVFLAVSAKPWGEWSTPGFYHTWSSMTFSMTHNQVTENSEALKIKPQTWLKKLKMLFRKKQ